MSMWLSNQSVSLALLVATGLRAFSWARCRWRVPPRCGGRSRGVVRLITVVAGH